MYDIAKKIPFIGGGLRYCRNHGRGTEGSGYHQVSMNHRTIVKTAIYRAFQMVRFEAKTLQVSIIGSEIVGLVLWRP